MNEQTVSQPTERIKTRSKRCVKFKNKLLNRIVQFRLNSLVPDASEFAFIRFLN